MKHIMSVYFGVHDHELRYFEDVDDKSNVDMLNVSQGVLCENDHDIV